MTARTTKSDPATALLAARCPSSETMMMLTSIMMMQLMKMPISNDGDEDVYGVQGVATQGSRPTRLGEDESSVRHEWVTILAQAISAQSTPPPARPARPPWLFCARANSRRPPSAGAQRPGGGRIKRGRRGAAFVGDSSRKSTWAATGTLPKWIGRNGYR